MTQTFNEAITKAINWWVENSFNKKAKQDAGDLMINAFSSFAANSVAGSITPQKVEIFKSALRISILQEKERMPNWVTISVDYDPCHVLSYAMKESGLSTLSLPIKTCMGIDKDNKVSVSHGYQSSWIEI